MSNKNKVRVYTENSCNHINYLVYRFRSRHFRLSSSAMLQINQYHPNCGLYSLVLVMPQVTRLLSGYISSVVNHTSTMFFPGITKHNSRIPLGRERERWWCRLPLEGLYFCHAISACVALIGGSFQQLNRYWRSRPSPSWRSQNQTSSQSRCIPWPWCCPYLYGRRNNAVPWLGLDYG